MAWTQPMSISTHAAAELLFTAACNHRCVDHNGPSGDSVKRNIACPVCFGATIRGIYTDIKMAAARRTIHPPSLVITQRYCCFYGTTMNDATQTGASNNRWMPQDTHATIAQYKQRKQKHLAWSYVPNKTQMPTGNSRVAEHRTQKVKKSKFSHTRYRALGPELIPVYRQSPRRWREVNHAIDLTVGCRYFLPGLRLPP